MSFLVEGEGFKVAMNILNNGRFGIPAACTGTMKYCIQKTASLYLFSSSFVIKCFVQIDHINSRTQFGKKLREFGNVQEKLTDMIAKLYSTESIVYMVGFLNTVFDNNVLPRCCLSFLSCGVGVDGYVAALLSIISVITYNK